MSPHGSVLAAPAALIARPAGWLGAPAPGRLALPAAHPTRAQLYAPRGVWCDERTLVVADSGNHRVLVWHDADSRLIDDRLADHAPASVVLGQPDACTEGPRAGGRGTAGGMHLPTGVCVADGRLVVADAWHHRLLVYDGVPRVDDARPAWVVGQDGADDAEPNRGLGAGRPHARGLHWPYGVAWLDGMLWVADTGNRRVLAFDGLPTPDAAPALVLGQPDYTSCDEHRGGAPGPHSFRWPHAVARHRGADGRATVWIADGGAHRVLGFAAADRRPGPDARGGAVLGQVDAHATRELPHVPQGPARLRFPYGVACAGDVLAVADTANNRVLLWDAPPAAADDRQPLVAGVPADLVLGQDDFAGGGENRWRAVTRDSLCWPYGLHLHDAGDGRLLLVVADSGNNRVTRWTVERAPVPA